MKRVTLIVAVVVVLAIFGIFFFEKVWNDRQLLVQNVQSTSKSVSSDSNRDVISEGENKKDVQGSQSVSTAGYKIVRVSDGKTAFSFEVPEKWAVETRHDGERALSSEEMREFLGDVDPYYADKSLKLTERDIQDAFFKKEDGNSVYPNASVSANKKVGYMDTAWVQTDFFIVPKSAEKLILEKKQKLMSFCEQWKEDCGRFIWEESTVGGKSSNFLINPVAKDAKGNEAPNKEEPGGGEYFVPISSEKTLVIDKQAKGDAQYEKDFDHLIATLKFE